MSLALTLQREFVDLAPDLDKETRASALRIAGWLQSTAEQGEDIEPESDAQARLMFGLPAVPR